MLEQEGATPKLFPQSWEHEIQNILVCVRSSFHWFSSNRQTQPEKRDSSLQRTRLHCPGVQWQFALHHCIPGALFYTPVAMEVTGTTEFNDLEGCPNTFGNTVFVDTALLMHFLLFNSYGCKFK